MVPVIDSVHFANNAQWHTKQCLMGGVARISSFAFLSLSLSLEQQMHANALNSWIYLYRSYIEINSFLLNLLFFLSLAVAPSQCRNNGRTFYIGEFRESVEMQIDKVGLKNRHRLRSTIKRMMSYSIAFRAEWLPYSLNPFEILTQNDAMKMGDVF